MEIKKDIIANAEVKEKSPQGEGAISEAQAKLDQLIKENPDLVIKITNQEQASYYGKKIGTIIVEDCTIRRPSPTFEFKKETGELKCLDYDDIPTMTIDDFIKYIGDIKKKIEAQKKETSSIELSPEAKRVQEQQKQAQYVIPGQQYLHYLPEGTVKVEGNPEILKKYGFRFMAERDPSLSGKEKAGGSQYQEKTGDIVCKCSEGWVYRLQYSENTDMSNPKLTDYTPNRPINNHELRLDRAKETEKIVVEGGTDENGADFITVKRYFKPEKDGSQKGDIIRIFLHK